MTRVLILYNEPVLPVGHPEAESEHEILQTVQAVASHLAQAGFDDVETLAAGPDPLPFLESLRRLNPDVVFNLFEGTGEDAASESLVAALLDSERIPYTGSPASALTLARDKCRAKQLFQNAGLPTPASVTVKRLPIPKHRLRWPLIVKPGQVDASIGLDHESVVADRISLEERVNALLLRYGPPVLVEEYIDGRELEVALVERPSLEALAIGEIHFTNPDRARWPILTYEAKWRPGSVDYESTPAVYPAQIDRSVRERLIAIAKHAFSLFGCRDYARADFRVHCSGEPFLLEINPNPAYHPEAGLAKGLDAAGISHADFTAHLVRQALARADMNLRGGSIQNWLPCREVHR
jgi:D-alanine-D-alanine ligase